MSCYEAYDQINQEMFVEGADPLSDGSVKPEEPYVFVFEALGRYFSEGNVNYLYRVGRTKRLAGFMSQFKALNRPRRFALLQPDGGESEKRDSCSWPELSDYVCDRLKSRPDFNYVIQFGLKWFTTTHSSTTVDAILHEIWEERSQVPEADVKDM
jgi:hypothetical protein